MERNAAHIAFAYLKHWLLKEDRYSQQSPFIFSVYQGALDLNETITKSLNQVTQGKLLKIQASESLAQAKEAELRQIQEQQSFDFILIHPQSSQEYLQEALSLFLPRMHAQGIQVLEGIHHSQGMYACWKRVQADTGIQLTLDFFDFGVAFKSYSGPKTNLHLSY